MYSAAWLREASFDVKRLLEPPWPGDACRRLGPSYDFCPAAGLEPFEVSLLLRMAAFHRALCKDQGLYGAPMCQDVLNMVKKELLPAMA